MIGVFGGAFNPIHMGHLMMAEYMRTEFCLDKVLFIPVGKPPHKPDDELESAQHRYNLVKLAIEGNPFFEASDIELVRSGTSYTSDTLTELAEYYPDNKLAFICGADSIVHLPTWHDIRQIFEKAEILAAGRSDTPDEEFRSMVRRFEEQYGARIRYSSMPLIEISSTQIRDRLKKGLSVRYMVPDRVLDYIQLHSLYY